MKTDRDLQTALQRIARAGHRCWLATLPYSMNCERHPGPTSHMASLQQVPPQCAGIWWSGGRTKRSGPVEHYEEREQAGDSTGGWRGLSCCEWSALSPGAVVIRSQPELPLRAMSESVATQQQGLVSMPMPHVTIREREDVWSRQLPGPCE